MRSITSRLVIGTSIVLSVFVILVGLSVSYSVHQRAETARLDRLQGLIYGILGATDIDDNASLSVNTLALPDPILSQSTAGLYAELVGSDGEKLWQSTSTTSWIPQVKVRPIGDWLFETTQGASTSPLHRLQLATAWEFANGEEIPFIVHVVSEADSLAKQLKRFDRTLWASLAIERGNRDSLTERVPAELQSLTMGLNALLGAERERHSQYRHLLDDLAHSLKTPLSVLQNLSKPNQAERDTILEQTRFMRQSIERHTQRANIRSPRYLAPMVNVLAVIERTCSSLNKLYESSRIEFNLDGINSDFTVRMDEADLYEVVGNILENACKYGCKTIWVSAKTKSNTLIFEDDGPGFPDIDLNQLAQRGVRADSQTQGSGMGLAAVQQLMAAHGGQLLPTHRPQGGAHIALIFLQ